MSDFDLNRLRTFLDEEERFARSIPPDAAGGALAKKMLELIADARAQLRPSADGTANYVPVKDIIQGIAALRARIEDPGLR